MNVRWWIGGEGIWLNVWVVKMEKLERMSMIYLDFVILGCDKINLGREIKEIEKISRV